MKHSDSFSCDRSSSNNIRYVQIIIAALNGFYFFYDYYCCCYYLALYTSKVLHMHALQNIFTNPIRIYSISVHRWINVRNLTTSELRDGRKKKYNVCFSYFVFFFHSIFFCCLWFRVLCMANTRYRVSSNEFIMKIKKNTRRKQQRNENASMYFFVSCRVVLYYGTAILIYIYIYLSSCAKHTHAWLTRLTYQIK